jgi:hypothetical protein
MADPPAVDPTAVDLRELQIEGYRIEFSTRVALLPVELAEVPGRGEGEGRRDG